jgi:hypothetical protein
MGFKGHGAYKNMNRGIHKAKGIQRAFIGGLFACILKPYLYPLQI